jgi:hypothetical protein
MTTVKQIEANRKNARRSTGPRTPAGKARVAQNALRHGLGAMAPVLPGEDPADWEAHRAGVLLSLRPVGTLEEALACRVAVCLWRMQRAAAYETAVTAVGLDEVEDDARQAPSFTGGPSDHQRLEKLEEEMRKKQEVVAMWNGTLHLLERLPNMADDAKVDPDDANGALHDLIGALPEGEGDDLDVEGEEFLADLGVPEDALDDAFGWTGWTAGMIRQAAELMSPESGPAPEKLLASALAGRRTTQALGRAAVAQLEKQAKELRRRVQAREDRLRVRRMLPPEDTLAKLSRYEAHLSRQMLQSLHELQRLQAARAGEPIPPPAALDVTVEAGGEAASNGFVSHESCSPG